MGVVANARANSMQVVALLLLGVFWVTVFGDDALIDLLEPGAVFLIGLTVVVPLARVLTQDSETTTAGSDDTTQNEDPLVALRRRYADGELTDEEFDRRLERLLETETREDAQTRVEREQGTLERQ